MPRNRSGVLWIGPQTARETSLDRLVQLFRTLEAVLGATLPDSSEATPMTVREAVRLHCSPELMALIERIEQCAKPIDHERKIFDDLFAASTRGKPAQQRAPEIGAMVANASGPGAMLGALLSRLFAAAAQEAADMDRAGASILAGEARAQHRGNLIVRQHAAPRAGHA